MGVPRANTASTIPLAEFINLFNKAGLSVPPGGGGELTEADRLALNTILNANIDQFQVGSVNGVKNADTLAAPVYLGNLNADNSYRIRQVGQQLHFERYSTVTSQYEIITTFGASVTTDAIRLNRDPFAFVAIVETDGTVRNAMRATTQTLGVDVGSTFGETFLTTSNRAIKAQKIGEDATTIIRALTDDTLVTNSHDVPHISSSSISGDPIDASSTVAFLFNVQEAGVLFNVRIFDVDTNRYAYEAFTEDQFANGQGFTTTSGFTSYDLNPPYSIASGTNQRIEVRFASDVTLVGGTYSGNFLVNWGATSAPINFKEIVAIPNWIADREYIDGIPSGVRSWIYEEDRIWQLKNGQDGVQTGTFDDNRSKWQILDNPQSQIDSLNTRVLTLENTAFNSGRSFVRFNDGFTIDRNNLATFEDKNIIYTAKNDKAPDNPTAPNVNLPNDAEIQASAETYPISFEFTHLGGSVVSETTNRLRLLIDGVQIANITRDQVVVVTKTADGVDYVVNEGNFDPGDTILPTGVFNLKTDTPIDNIANIAAELSGITLVAGDAFLVSVGGTWSGYTVPDNSILVAIVNGASTLDDPDNNDWLLLDNPRVNAESAAFLANYTRDGIAFNANRNITVDPSNVLEFNAIASGTPLEREVGTNTQGFNRSITYANVPIQFTDLIGGRLQLGIFFNLTSTSGFPPEWLNMTITYPGGIVFDFPLNGAPLNGMFVAEIDVPTVDYTAALNQDATVSLFYNFTGVSFFGSYTINSLVNMSTGRLHQAVSQIAQVESLAVEARLTTQINALRGDVDQEDASIEALIPRVSPYLNLPVSTPDVYARFLNSNGVDSFPSDVDAMTLVSPSNPRFEGNNVALYVAVRPGGIRQLNNITQSTSIFLDDSTPNVDLGESLRSSDGFTYFIYRVTSLTASDVYEVDAITQEQVVAWQNSINNLDADIARIDAELKHALLNLSDDVVSVFENDVNVTEEVDPVILPSAYNEGLGSTGSQTIFYETDPNTFDGTVLKSKPIEDNKGTDRYRNKLVYMDKATVYQNQTYLTAFDGTTSTDLIEYINGTFFGKVFVPSIPGGTVITTIYPNIQNRVSGPGIWNNIPALTFVNGVPVPLADEVFFTGNVPPVTTGVTIQYRGHANGNIFGTGSIVLPANQDSISFILDDGGEQATVQVRRRTNNRISVSVTERVNTGLPTINDVEVILSYQDIRVVPATPATTRTVEIEHVTQGKDQVFGIKADASGNLILIGSLREINTGYPFTTLFNASETGFLSIAADNSVFLDYEDIDIIASTIVSLEDHSVLPQLGLFTTNYTHETVLNFTVQMTVRDSSDVERNVGNVLTDLLSRVTALEA